MTSLLALEDYSFWKRYPNSKNAKEMGYPGLTKEVVIQTPQGLTKKPS
jgi:hypothetical protein